MLLYALERFEAGDVRAEESLRAIRGDLSSAIAACIDAAKYEFSSHVIKQYPDPLFDPLFWRAAILRVLHLSEVE